MEQIRVNLTLERQIWKKFGELVPNRQKSRVVNELLKSEITRKIQQNEEKALRLAFSEASEDKERQATIRGWESLDAEDLSQPQTHTNQHRHPQQPVGQIIVMTLRTNFDSV